MYLAISSDGNLTLQEIDDMDQFSISQSMDDDPRGLAVNALQSCGEALENNHYWIDADFLISLSTRKNDQQWLDQFWAMLKKVEPYGYSDLENRRVKAHVGSN